MVLGLLRIEVLSLSGKILPLLRSVSPENVPGAVRSLSWSFTTFMPLDKSNRITEADSFISWQANVPVKLRIEDSVPGNYPPILVQTMMRNVVQQHPERKALAIKRNGEWKTWNYAQYYHDVRKVAKGFMFLGLEPFHGVGIMGTNTPEWFMSSLGAIFGGGLSCGIYATNSPHLVTYICGNATLDFLVMEDEALLKKILDGRSFEKAFPKVKKMVLVKSSGDYKFAEGENVLTWQKLLEIGGLQPDSLLEEAESRQVANSACMLVYTSGTTGPPKGAILSHDNVTWSSRISIEHYEWGKDREIAMSYLPLSHIAALMADCFMVMGNASTTYFADKDAIKGTLVDNLKEIRPTRFFGVPRVWEKIEEQMEKTVKKSNPWKKAMINWARSIASEHHRAVRDGKQSGESLNFKLAKRFVLDRIRHNLGLDRTISAYSGAAPLSPSTFDFFESFNIVLQEAFGSTETSLFQTTNLPGINMRVGTLGRSYFGVNNAIDNADKEGNGEIITYSRNIFMGYQNDEERTKAAFTDKLWFRSGDLGRFDADGFLILNGRMKDLIITAGGENVAPTPIEEAIKKELQDVVSHAIVVGEKRKYLTCLLTLKVRDDESTSEPTKNLSDSAKSWATSKLGENCSISTISDFTSGPSSEKLHSAIQTSLDAVNEKAVSNAQRIQKFLILPQELSVSGGELGPSLKVKRFLIYDKYEKKINYMYEK